MDIGEIVREIEFLPEPVVVPIEEGERVPAGVPAEVAPSAPAPVPVGSVSG